MAKHAQLLIIGSGPAGLTAAIYGARTGLQTVVVAGMQPGGQLTTTSYIENFPGFPAKIGGYELMKLMEDQAKNMGAEIVLDVITEVKLDRRPFVLTGDGGEEYTAESLVVATGASARWLGLESEKKFNGAGVSACATCDGFFFKNRRVVVVGGGNAAVEEALYLANLASSVTLIHRRDSLRAEKVMQDRAIENPKISVEWDSVVEEIIGTDQPKKVTGVLLKNVKTGLTKQLDADGVFIAVGHKPNTGLFESWLDIDDDGYIVTAPNSARTSVDGVFAAGDVQDRVFRQAVTSAGTGCMAALEAYAYYGRTRGK